MSTKTIKQRIALVAVSALTAGFISVVSAPAANAASADLTVEANAAADNVAAASATKGSGVSQGLISGAGIKTNSSGVATMFSNGVLALFAQDPTTAGTFTVMTISGGTFSGVAGGSITAATASLLQVVGTTTAATGDPITPKLTGAVADTAAAAPIAPSDSGGTTVTVRVATAVPPSIAVRAVALL